MVRRMVEAINEGSEAEAVDELFEPRAARRVKRLFAKFRSAFPDWREEVVQLVAEGDTVAGASAARGPTLGSSWARRPRARGWTCRRSSSCVRRAAGSWTSGDWRTAWAGCGSWA